MSRVAQRARDRNAANRLPSRRAAATGVPRRARTQADQRQVSLFGFELDVRLRARLRDRNAHRARAMNQVRLERHVVLAGFDEDVARLRAALVFIADALQG